MSRASHKRHIAKAITWRIVGTADTAVLGWIFTGNPLTGLKIGLAEVLTKTFLYYMHERAWFGLSRKKLRWLTNSHIRHITKTFTWRFVGTSDTIVLAWIISGDPLIGLQVGAVELVTKMTLYYLHERAWYRVAYGLRKKVKNESQPVLEPALD